MSVTFTEKHKKLDGNGYVIKNVIKFNLDGIYCTTT